MVAGSSFRRSSLASVPTKKVADLHSLMSSGRRSATSQRGPTPGRKRFPVGGPQSNRMDYPKGSIASRKTPCKSAGASFENIVVIAPRSRALASLKSSQALQIKKPFALSHQILLTRSGLNTAPLEFGAADRPWSPERLDSTERTACSQLAVHTGDLGRFHFLPQIASKGFLYPEKFSKQERRALFLPAKGKNQNGAMCIS
jgi:hypothetical protein